MEYAFCYSEEINGASVFAIEGRATVEHDAGTDDWAITGINVDACLKGKWVEIDLPETHWLYQNILSFLLSKETRFDIDQQWDEYVKEQRAEAA